MSLSAEEIEYFKEHASDSLQPSIIASNAAACLPTLAVLATKAHLSKVSTSLIHLLSVTFSRSHGSSASNTRASGHSVLETRSDGSLARGTSGGSRNPMHQGNGDVSPFVAGSLTERGERSKD